MIEYYLYLNDLGKPEALIIPDKLVDKLVDNLDEMLTANEHIYNHTNTPKLIISLI